MGTASECLGLHWTAQGRLTRERHNNRRHLLARDSIKTDSEEFHFISYFENSIPIRFIRTKLSQLHDVENTESTASAESIEAVDSQSSGRGVRPFCFFYFNFSILRHTAATCQATSLKIMLIETKKENAEKRRGKCRETGAEDILVETRFIQVSTRMSVRDRTKIEEDKGNCRNTSESRILDRQFAAQLQRAR